MAFVLTLRWALCSLLCQLRGGYVWSTLGSTWVPLVCDWVTVICGDIVINTAADYGSMIRRVRLGLGLGLGFRFRWYSLPTVRPTRCSLTCTDDRVTPYLQPAALSGKLGFSVRTLWQVGLRGRIRRNLYYVRCMTKSSYHYIREPV
jgi:hypothetical protein